MQEGMLFHSLETERAGVDIEQVFGELHENLDPASFEKAWSLVVERHAILRTSFHWRAETGPRQVAQDPPRLPIRYLDWPHASERDMAEGLEEYLRADRNCAFKLDELPLFRLAVIRSATSSWRFVFTFHHLLLDGRSIALVLREVFALHDAFVAHRPIELPPPPSYWNYIDWLKGRDIARSENFWRERLRGFASSSPLPLDRAAGEEMDSGASPGEASFELPVNTTTRLYGVARQNQVTANTLVQAAWALLLSRSGGVDDVVFGAVRACRKIPVDGAEEMVGLFINTVPLRVQINDDEPLGSWLRRLRSQGVELREYEHAPLAQVQRWSDVPAGRPLFDTLVNFQDPSWNSALRALGGKWINRRFQIRSRSNYPLALDVCGGPQLSVKLLFDTRIISADSAERLLGHYRNLLESMVANPFQKLGDIELLGPSEARQLVGEWSGSDRDYPRDRCVHELFEAQAAKAASRLAVADSRNEMTYGELNTRANRLAQRLRSLGVAADVPVIVCMERSAEMILAWLAVLKSGGAFVPLDPSYPPDRLAMMCRDSRAAVFLTQERTLDVLPPLSRDLSVVCVEAGVGSSGRESGKNLTSKSGPANIAYVIYTSGSTGQPKGVQVEHHSLVNLATWHRETYAVGPEDRASQVASPAFDASVWEVWPYLTAGASIHFPEQETRIAPSKLVDWLTQQRITLAFLPTPLAEAVMNERWPAGSSLRALLTGGDRLTRRPPKNFPCVLINHYGPTECAVVATSATVEPGAPTGQAPPIGRPIANTRVYVLDRKFRPVPIGLPGELYIGGAGVARGYLHRPELTAERFVRDTFGADSAGRLYRTGDRVRWLSSGQLEFLGRLDEQVKIRGHRIEPGEVEWVLAQHPSVRQAAVIARNDGNGTQLAAYLVPEFADTPDTIELGWFLGRQLPDYMIPARFLWVERLPLTANGKVDRRALPALEAPGGRDDRPSEAPRNPTEENLAKIWCEVLGRKSIGIHDSFFELGGHSLLAAQLIARARAEFGVDLSVRALFDHPTIALLAPAFQGAQHPGPAAMPIRRRRPQLGCVAR